MVITIITITILDSAIKKVENCRFLSVTFIEAEQHINGVTMLCKIKYYLSYSRRLEGLCNVQWRLSWLRPGDGNQSKIEVCLYFTEREQFIEERPHSFQTLARGKRRSEISVGQALILEDSFRSFVSASAKRANIVANQPRNARSTGS